MDNDRNEPSQQGGCWSNYEWGKIMHGFISNNHSYFMAGRRIAAHSQRENWYATVMYQENAIEGIRFNLTLLFQKLI